MPQKNRGLKSGAGNPEWVAKTCWLQLFAVVVTGALKVAGMLPYLLSKRWLEILNEKRSVMSLIGVQLNEAAMIPGDEYFPQVEIH